jgi:hypothetical protein
MLEAIDSFRVLFGGRPLLLSIPAFVLLVVAVRRSARPMVHATRAAAAAGLLGLTTYVAAAVWYGAQPHFFDNAEPTMAALGWLSYVGQPLYPSFEAAERYAHIYGPVAYMTHGAALAAFGPSIAASKAVGVLAGLSSLALLGAAVRRHVSVRRSLVLTGVCALLLLSFRNYSFWTRPDPLQLVAVSAALLAAVCGRGYLSAVLVGVMAGVVLNLKFTGPLYVLPVFVLAHHRSGWRRTWLTIGVAFATAWLPFALSSTASLASYLAWVRLSADTGLLLSTLRQNLEWAVYFCVPVLLSYYAVPPEARPAGAEWRDVVTALLLGISGVVIAAAKPGAGPYHLMPFLPVITYLIAWHLAGQSPSPPVDSVVPAGAAAFLIVAASIALAQQTQLVTTVLGQRALRDTEDVRRFAESHDGVIEMGYAETEARSLQRPVLVFRNGSYLIDQPAVREHQLAGLEIPAATVEAVAGCRVTYWLIPKNEAPFSARNGYAAAFLRPLYSEEFRRAFFATHRRVGQTAYYDVWQCQPRTSR